MPEIDYHRHDISDKIWELLKPHLPGQRGQWGGIAKDNRRFIKAVFFILRTGSTWRDLPPDYGKWGTVHQRFMRWQRKGTWKKILDILIDEPECQFLMIDATHTGGLGRSRAPPLHTVIVPAAFYQPSAFIAAGSSAPTKKRHHFPLSPGAGAS